MRGKSIKNVGKEYNVGVRMRMSNV